MPEVEVPRVSEAAPTYRLDVQLHELLMKPPEQPRLLPPPPRRKGADVAGAGLSSVSRTDGSAGRRLLPKRRKAQLGRQAHLPRDERLGVSVHPLASACRASSTRSLRTCSMSGSAISTATIAGPSTTACVA